MASDLENKKQTREVRRQFLGTPDELAPHLKRIAEKTTCRSLNYYLVPGAFKQENTPYYKAFSLCCGKYQRFIYFVEDETDNEEDKGYAKNICEITLQSLPDSKTLFIAEYGLSDFDTDGALCEFYLDALQRELKKLGFIESILKRIWRIIKELLGIAKTVKP
jgi:hypothetical protein